MSSNQYDQAFKMLGLEPQEYFVKFALPLTLAFVVAGLILYIFVGRLLGGFSFIFLTLPLFGLLVALIYPKVIVDKKRVEINQNLHLFITHAGTLSTADMERKGLFRIIGEKEEYQELSRQAKLITKLVQDWRMSLPEACKFQAARCPSKIFSDFLERFAYNVDAGQEVEDFLVGEQAVIMSEFETMYVNALKDVDIFKELFLSMILSIAFAVVFAIILPAITGMSPTILVISTVFLFAIVEVAFLYAMYSRIPNDPLWGKFDAKTSSEKRIDKWIYISIGAILVLSAIILLSYFKIAFAFINQLPLIMRFTIPLTPLLLPGIISRKVESEIKGRDKQFPSFIRSLGAAESAKQTTTTHALRTLQHKDFGELTNLVRNLYKRLNLRISQERSWEMFIKEAESFLIHKFSTMYYDSRLKGGVPDKLGKIIAKNVEKIHSLRTHRNQTSTTLVGVLYGITASLSFSLYVGIMVVNMMAESMSSISLETDLSVSSVVTLTQYNIGEVSFLMVLILLIHALLSSVMIKIVDGGHQVNAYFHFVNMMWISAMCAYAVEVGMGSFINI
ncbi:MAG: archaellar assembly protein FlaJ [Archaeoglobaceae archaeon]